VRNLNYDDADADDSVPEPHEEPTLQATAAEPEAEKAKKPGMTPLEATITLARRGIKKVLPILRRALDEHPELWEHVGNLALQTQENWLRLVAGKDLLLAEAMRRHLDAMRSELAGTKPSPLDRLLIDRILATNVQAMYFDAMETTDPTAENMRVARYRMDRREQAHKQFLSAVKMLATVRNLVARTNVIQVELIHKPPTPSPIMAGANGSMYQGKASGAQRASHTEPATSFNGVNRFGAGRRAGITETMGASVDG